MARRYSVAPAALWELGAEVIKLGVEPDGFNINKDCGSTAPEALAAKVREMRADIGIALDGDADRVVIVDERGHVVDGDQILAVIAESWNEDGRLSKPSIVATVMSNYGFEKYLKSIKLGPGAHAGRRSPCSRSHARAGHQRRRRTVGSYHSFRPHDDRRRLRRRVAGACGGEKEAAAKVSEICHRYDPLPQVTKNVRYKQGKPHEHAKVRTAIANGEQRLNGHGRLIVRPSGTEPVIRVTAEGDDKLLVEDVVDGIVSALSEVAA